MFFRIVLEFLPVIVLFGAVVLGYIAFKLFKNFRRGFPRFNVKALFLLFVFFLPAVIYLLPYFKETIALGWRLLFPLTVIATAVAGFLYFFRGSSSVARNNVPVDELILSLKKISKDRSVDPILAKAAKSLLNILDTLLSVTSIDAMKVRIEVIVNKIAYILDLLLKEDPEFICERLDLFARLIPVLDKVVDLISENQNIISHFDSALLDATLTDIEKQVEQISDAVLGEKVTRVKSRLSAFNRVLRKEAKLDL